MTDVHLTVDVEIWPGRWERLQERFPEFFRHYIYGPSSTGDSGLPLMLKVLADHGLRATFFVESLFASGFGLAPLEEIVGMLVEAGHAVELHAHPEWLDKFSTPLLPGVAGWPLSRFDAAAQTRIIAQALCNLRAAGVAEVKAFRAGSFAGSLETIEALRRCDIGIDSSYNPVYRGHAEQMFAGPVMQQPFEISGVTEYPMSVFEPWPGRLRSLQVTAASFPEMAYVLSRAHDVGWSDVVVLSHNSEMLDDRRIGTDRLVVRRLRKLCRFLDRYRADLPTRDFAPRTGSLSPTDAPEVIRSNVLRTGLRVGEQALRRVVALF